MSSPFATPQFFVYSKKGDHMNTLAQKMDKDQMKRSNRQLIFTQIHSHGVISRTELAKLTGLTPMSIGRIADEFIQKGLVQEESPTESGKSVGRRPRLLQVASDSIRTLGLELDRDCLRAGVLDFNGNVTHKLEKNILLADKKPEEVVALAAELLLQLQSNGNTSINRVCGVVCPGIIDSENGIVQFSSQLQWNNVPFAQMLCNTGVVSDVTIDNEVKARAQAEVLFGQGQNYRCVSLLNFGSGVGSSLVVDRKLYRGHDNMAGEIGHICIDPNGNLCECGRRGCLQSYLSDLSILQDARKFDPDSTLDSLFAAFARKEFWASNIIHHMVKYAGIAAGMINNLYAPNIIILCGRLIETYPVLQSAIKTECITQLSNSVVVTTSQLGRDGNLVGAGTLAFYLDLNMND